MTFTSQPWLKRQHTNKNKDNKYRNNIKQNLKLKTDILVAVLAMWYV